MFAYSACHKYEIERYITRGEIMIIFFEFEECLELSLKLNWFPYVGPCSYKNSIVLDHRFRKDFFLIKKKLMKMKISNKCKFLKKCEIFFK